MSVGFDPKVSVRRMVVDGNVALMGAINRVKMASFVSDMEAGRNVSEKNALKPRSHTDCVKLMEEELDANFQIARKVAKEAVFAEHTEAGSDAKHLTARKVLNEAISAPHTEGFEIASLTDVFVRTVAEDFVKYIVVGGYVKSKPARS